jgi:hypothetical protein
MALAIKVAGGGYRLSLIARLPPKGYGSPDGYWHQLRDDERRYRIRRRVATPYGGTCAEVKGTTECAKF